MPEDQPRDSTESLYEEREAYAPAIIFEHDHKPGHYSLLLTDTHMVALMGTFQAAGYEGHGYDWNGVAMQAAREAGVLGRFDTDPEAGMFAAYGTDLEALQIVGAALAEAHANPDKLAALIAAGDPNDFD